MQTKLATSIDERNKRRHDPEIKTGHLYSVDYIGHRAAVKLKGSGFLSSVRFAESVKVGTSDNPLIWAGNFCQITKVKHRYVITEVENRTKCEFPVAVVDPEDDEDFGTVELDSFTTSSFPSTITPYDTFDPPTFSGESFSPEGFGPTGEPLYIAGGYNGAIASGVTQEDLFHSADYIVTLLTITLYSPDPDVTLLIDLNTVNVITATRAGGDWTVNGDSAGSADDVIHFALATPVAITRGDKFRSAIQADGDVTMFGYSVGGA